MNQPAKAQEPSMEEILASIRRIIADDDASKTTKPAEPATPKAPPVAAVPARPAPPPPRAPAPPPRPAPAVANSQEDIDAMLADIEQNGGGSAPEVLDLTESMAASTPSPANFRTIDGQSDVVFSDRAAAPAPPPPEPAPRYDEPPRTATPMPDHGLLSNSTTNAVDNAFNSLAHTVLAQNARTLDDIVREMLRPMLKAWLDDNLPGMVERIVRAEIERVSRGRP